MHPLFLTDSYKLSHKGFMTKGTEFIYSNGTPRNFGYLPVIKEDFDNKVINYGLQRVIKQVLISHFDKKFFHKKKAKTIAKVKRMFDAYLGKDSVPVAHFEELWDLGYLPIQIKALPEGVRVGPKVPVFTITNTHPRFAWLTNYLETVISAELWKSITVATIIAEYRKLCNDWAMKTVGSIEGTEYQNHDFSFRGMSGWADSAVCGAAFLLSSCGTDNIPALAYIEKYYNADVTKEFIGTSVPASEHSLASTGIAVDGELETIRRWITQDYPTGIVSVIADTEDFFRVVTEYAAELKEDILARKVNEFGLAKTVFRPDCYDSTTSILTPSGWVLFSDLTEDDLVAQVLDDGSYEFVKPTKIVNQEYTGSMVKYYDHHGKVDLLVTPNHRMIIEQRNRLDGEWAERVVLAEKLGTAGKKGTADQRLARSACAPELGVNLTPEERLKIAFQADGSFGSQNSTSRIRFSFAKERKMERLEEILKDLPYEWKKYDLADGKYEYSINVIDSSLYQKDLNWVDTSCLSKTWCEEFIEELSYWDATRRHDDRFKFDTTNESVINVVELVCIGAGYGVLLSLSEDTRSDKFNDVFTAHILKDKYIGGQARWKEIIPYSGTVHCVTVPTGRVLVKRGRATAVCGNSGNPVHIVAGYRESELDRNDGRIVIKASGKEVSEAEAVGAVECLARIFGTTQTSKGYKQLHERVGLIYGDSITLARAKEIFQRLAENGYASTNTVFGVGSFTCQYLTRDSIGFAVKATAAVVEGKLYELSKDPVTDDGTKKSAKGLLRVELESGEYKLYDQQTSEQEEQGELKVVFLDGVLEVDEAFSTIRERVSEYTNQTSKAP